MLDAIASIATLIGALVALGLAALATLAGAVMAVVSGPDDRPIEIPARTACIGLAAFGLFGFMGTTVFIARFCA